MRTTIDSAGRVVIPRELRNRAGFAGGQEVEIQERQGRIEIEPAPTSMSLQTRRGGVVAVAAQELPALTDEMVRETLDRVRR